MLRFPMPSPRSASERLEFLVDDKPLPDELVGETIDGGRRIDWLADALTVLSERELRILARATARRGSSDARGSRRSLRHFERARPADRKSRHGKAAPRAHRTPSGRGPRRFRVRPLLRRLLCSLPSGRRTSGCFFDLAFLGQARQRSHRRARRGADRAANVRRSASAPRFPSVSALRRFPEPCDRAPPRRAGVRNRIVRVAHRSDRDRARLRRSR